MIDDKAVLKRIQDMMYIRGMQQQDLSLALGLSRSAYTEWKAGRSRAFIKRIDDIARVLDVTPEYLLNGDGETAAAPLNLIQLPETKKVPLLGDIACGEPITAIENIQDFVTVPMHIAADMALVCKGDSMTGARIYDGDIVYIRQQESVENGEIAAVLIGDEATLKRVFIRKDHIVLMPDNPKYTPLIYIGSEMESVRIIGKAVAFTSAVR